MADYICIDGGTTNTRISLVIGNQVVDTLKFNIGAKSGIDDKSLLKDTIKNGICEVLKKNDMKESDITQILASGMLTSEFGLLDLPHITVPAGISELHNSMYEKTFEDITTIPFTFIRGVKTVGDELEKTDMMRGEETEQIGVFECEGIYIFSGSHSKIIRADNSGRIVDFKTMLTGEMIAALSENTILKDAVDIKTAELDEEYLLGGYHFCKEHGINQALFKVRILKNLFGKNASRVYSFYMGIILCDEIQYVLSLKTDQIIVTGQSQIKEAIVKLLHQLTPVNVTMISDKGTDESTIMGMIKIFEYSK